MNDANEKPDFHTIDLPRLRQIINAIFDHMIEDLDLKTVSIAPTETFYWELDEKQARDPSTVPEAAENGRLSDDWQFLQPVKRGAGADASYNLVHVYPLLRYLANRVQK